MPKIPLDNFLNIRYNSTITNIEEGINLMEKAEAKQIANERINHFLGDSWTFEFMTKKRVFGTCCYKTKTISLSVFYIKLAEFADIEETIMHEIAHALVGPGHGHDEHWKAQMRALGYPNAKATRRIEHTSIDSYIESGAKWLLIEPNGKIVREWYRKPADKTFATIKNKFIPGRKEETLGKLKIVRIEEYGNV